MKKNLLIIVDLEGIWGVRSIYDDKANAVLLYDELTAMLEAIPTSYEIYLCYDHNNGSFPETMKAFDDSVHIIQKVDRIDFGICYERAFLIGFHGRKFDDGKFPHTYRDEIDSLLLGNKDIGEIELIANQLAYYNIPLVLVSAEQCVIDHLEYDCIYHVIDDNKDSQVIYENLKRDTLNALEYSSNCIQYDPSKIKVIYDDFTLSSAKRYNMTLQTDFENTMAFCEFLKEIHLPLNEIIRKNIDRMYSSILANKPKSIDEIQDEYIKRLLYKDAMTLHYYEIRAISSCFEAMKLER